MADASERRVTRTSKLGRKRVAGRLSSDAQSATKRPRIGHSKPRGS